MSKTSSSLATLCADELGSTITSHATASTPRQSKKTPARPARKAQKVSRAKLKEQASPSKQDLVIQMLLRSGGVTIKEIAAKTGWQAHSVRGFFSGVVKKKLTFALTSNVGKDSVRRYHITTVGSPKT